MPGKPTFRKVRFDELVGFLFINLAVHNRVSTEISLAIMKIDDMYICRNASLIVNEYLSMGNMLQCIKNVAGKVSYSVVLDLFNSHEFWKKFTPPELSMEM